MAGKKIRYSKLVALSNSRYEIVFDEPDIRKWKVRNASGKYLGFVSDLLIDPQVNKVRYIVLDLQGKPLNLLSRKILIPIGIAELDDMDDVVILPGITIEQLATLPTYGKGKLSIETERRTGYIFTRAGAANEEGDAQEEISYDDEYFNDNNLRNRKRKPAPVTRGTTDDNVHNETTATKNDQGPFSEETIEITEHSEVPVITKEARVVEEVSLDKEITERDETIKDTVRNTEVEVEDLRNEKKSRV
jgi:hypothetical protein